MHLIPRLLTFCCALVAASAGMAAPLADLYKVREAVATQQPEEREQALRQAFDTLLVRLTGDTDTQNQGVAQLRQDPQQLISKYAYEEGAVVVDFDPLTTERALRSAGLSLWGADRPGVLVWWLTETVEGSQLVGDTRDGTADLQAAAQHRGLPLRLPLADLSEQLAVSAETLASKDPQELRELSERYDADGLLAVRARQSSERWEADWKFWLADKQTQGKATGADRGELADAVMLAVSTFLAPHYRVAPGATEEITLEVLGADVERFAELDRLLEPFGAHLLRVESDRLVYQLNASPEQLRAQLALARLQEVPVDEIAAPRLLSEAEVSADVDTPLDAESPLEAPEQSAAEQPQQPDQGEVLRYRW